MAKGVGRGKGSKKGMQQVHNMKTRKYEKAFIRCVKRTGKWRGKKATVREAFCG